MPMEERAGTERVLAARARQCKDSTLKAAATMAITMPTSSPASANAEGSVSRPEPIMVLARLNMDDAAEAPIAEEACCGSSLTESRSGLCGTRGASDSCPSPCIASQYRAADGGAPQLFDDGVGVNGMGAARGGVAPVQLVGSRLDLEGAGDDGSGESGEGNGAAGVHEAASA